MIASTIDSVGLHRIVVRFRAPVRWGRSDRDGATVGLLGLTTRSGSVGWGEIAGPELPLGVETALEATRAMSIGCLPEDVEAAQGPPGIRAALDTALLDLMGQAADRPLGALLGTPRDSVAVNGLLTLDGRTDDQLADGVRSVVAEGFHTIKCKGSPDASLERRLRVVRDVAGQDMALRLDLNGTLGPDEAARLLARLESVGLEYVEQPLDPSHGPGALAALRARVGVRIAADEAVTDPASAARLVDAGAVDVLVVKPARVGGPRAAVAIARDAARHGVGVTISTLYETGIGLGAALHVAAVLPEDTAHGLATADLLLDDPTIGLPTVGRGRLTMSRDAGLGVRPRLVPNDETRP